MRDRRGSFWYVTTGASSLIRAHFAFPSQGGLERKTALAIYAAMCEVANEHRSSRFRETRETIRVYAGVSERTLDAYVAELAKAGLIEQHRRREGGLNLPSEWVLIDVPDVDADQRNGCADAARGGATIAPPLAQPLPHGGAATAPPRRVRVEEGTAEDKEEPPPPPQAGGPDTNESSGKGCAQLGPQLTPWPSTRRGRTRDRVAAERDEQFGAWLSRHPALSRAQLPPGAQAPMVLAAYLDALHVHQDDEAGLVLGVDGGRNLDSVPRFLNETPAVSEVFARPVRVIACGCPPPPPEATP